MDITELLSFAVKNNASDVHLSAGLPPMIRIDGDIRRINMPELSHKDVHGLIYDIMNDKQRKDYEEFFETDFSFLRERRLDFAGFLRLRDKHFLMPPGILISTFCHTLDFFQRSRNAFFFVVGWNDNAYAIYLHLPFLYD